MDCRPLVQSLVRVQLDDHSLSIDTRELMVLQIQELVLAVLNAQHEVDADEVKSYFSEYLQQRGFQSSWDKGQTVHFQEEVKRNYGRLMLCLGAGGSD